MKFRDIPKASLLGNRRVGFEPVTNALANKVGLCEMDEESLPRRELKKTVQKLKDDREGSRMIDQLCALSEGQAWGGLGSGPTCASYECSR